MRILYGIQGTGNGHLARARALVPALRRANIELDFLLSGRNKDKFFNMELFENFDWRAGLTLVFENGKLLPVATLVKNNPIRFIADIRNVNVDAYDLVICDFEPISAWSSKFANIPCLGISHQCSFSYGVPKVDGYLPSKLVTKLIAPVSKPIGLHWHHFNQPVLPPLIEDHTVMISVPEKILVYMAYEPIQSIVEFLSPFSNYDFQVFAPVSERSEFGHVCINPLSHTEFHQELESCGGVITNAGFELSSECLSLGKKLLVKPLAGQYEQLCNALALQSLSRATVITDLDTDLLKQWLELPGHKAVDYPSVADALATWIVSGMPGKLKDLADGLWEATDMPFEFNSNFGTVIKEKLIF